MKREMPELRKDAETPTPQPDTGNLTEAIKWVYKRYGTDLPSFFEDAYKDAARKRQEPPTDENIEAYSS